MRRPDDPFRPLFRLAGFALLGLLAACGDEEPQRSVPELLAVFESGNEEEVAAAVTELAARARAAPEAVVPVLAEALRNYEGDRYSHLFEFRIDAPEASLTEQADLVRRVGDLLPRRLADYGLGPGLFEITDSVVRLRLGRPSLDEEGMDLYIRGTTAQLSAPGTVELRLVVTDPANEEEVASLWDGDSASFRAYVAAEAKRLSEDMKAGRVFVPSNPRYRTVFDRPGPQGGTPGARVVYDPPDAKGRLDTQDLKVRGAIDPATRRAILEITIDKTRSAHMAAWSKKHHGRAVAFLVNGEARHITRLGSVLRNRAVLDVGDADSPETMNWLRDVVTATRTGPYPVRVQGELLPAKPEYLDLPVARALAQTGFPAQAALAEIAREGGPMAPVAQWALGEMTRIATGQKRVDGQR